ncbi:MAG: hypothetical protein Q9188_005296 [Gyalolechia gomerana]
MRLRPNIKRRGALFELKHFRDAPYTTFCIGKQVERPIVSFPRSITAMLISFSVRSHDRFISILYGFISGGMVSLPPAIIANLTEDLSEYGTRMGMGLTIASLGALVGNPIGGAAQRSEARGNVQTQYQGIWLFAGACMLMAVAAMLLTRYLKFGMTVKGRFMCDLSVCKRVVPGRVMRDGSCGAGLGVYFRLVAWRFVSTYQLPFGGVQPGAFLDRWTNENGFYLYPPQNGFQIDLAGNPILGDLTLRPGTRVDRFGSEYADAPYAQRALLPSNLDTPPATPEYPYNYRIYTVLKRLDVLGGPIAPWFGQPGLGTQFYTGAIGNVRTLIAQGYLARENITQIVAGAGQGNQCG